MQFTIPLNTSRGDMLPLHRLSPKSVYTDFPVFTVFLISTFCPKRAWFRTSLPIPLQLGSEHPPEFSLFFAPFVLSLIRLAFSSKTSFSKQLIPLPLVGVIIHHLTMFMILIVCKNMFQYYGFDVVALCPCLGIRCYHFFFAPISYTSSP